MTNQTLDSLISDVAHQRQPHCTPIEMLHAWVTGQLSEDQAEHVRTHVEECSFCSAEARLAGWFEDPAASPAVDNLAARLAGGQPRSVVLESAADVASTSWRSPRWLVMGLAAAATVLLVVGAYSAAPPVVPELLDGQVVRGGTVHVLEPQGDVSAIPERVIWEGGSADTYRVELLAVDGEILWLSSAATVAELPATAQDKLERGVTYRVRVTPVDSDGELLGRATEADFRIERLQIE